MKNNDFSFYIRKYLTHYLPIEKNFNSNTIDTYRTAFILMLEYLEEKGMKAENIEIKDITRAQVIGFMDWLESERDNSVSTRNNRLAAIHSFFRYLQYEYPDYMDEYRRIIAIPFKKAKNKEMAYLTVEEMKILLEQVDTTTVAGYRDYLLLFTMYETGARVSEICNIRIGDFRMSKPYSVKILGKGNKERTIPVSELLVSKIRKYLEMNGMEEALRDTLLFSNRKKEAYCRHGIAFILKKYISKAREIRPDLFAKDISPHTLRHTRAMHLLSDDVNLVYIRDILGHSSIVTTERYARADSAKKRKALEQSYKTFGNDNYQEWKNESVLQWLKKFNTN